MDAELLRRLEEVYALEKSSVIRYIVESSQAELRDDADRRAFAACEAWHRDSTRSLAALGKLLDEDGVVPDEAAYPIEFSQLNYLSARYLLGQMIPRMEAHVSRLEELAAGFAAWPHAGALVRSIAERGRIHLQRLQALEAERPKEPPPAPRIKGTSASRW
jgi:hypothetical protein